MSLTIDRYVLMRAYQENCYVVRPDFDGPAVVIDPGGSPQQLIAAKIDVKAILITHADIDHVLGVADLAEASKAEVWIPAGEADDLRKGMTRSKLDMRPYEPEHEVRDGDTVTAAGLTFEIVGIPGHSPDHVAYCTEGHLFTGDLLFTGGVGRVDLPGGDWATLLGSVKKLVDRFGPDAIVHPGHGKETTIGQELETNPFLEELRTAAK